MKPRSEIAITNREMKNKRGEVIQANQPVEVHYRTSHGFTIFHKSGVYIRGVAKSYLNFNC